MFRDDFAEPLELLKLGLADQLPDGCLGPAGDNQVFPARRRLTRPAL